MTKNNTIVHKDIINYYDNCQVDYSIVWHLNTHLSLHYGYWDTGINRLRQALVRMNDVLASKVQIRATDKVLDAGCGVGGAAIHLAQKFDCSVHGITLSEKQVAYATQRAEEKKMNQVKFSAADFTKMPFEDECFDVVWAVESVCHAHEKADFIKEAFRVLKKGGRLIVADFFRIMEKPNEDENYWLNNWGMSWAVPEFEYIKHFEQKAVTHGFENVKVDNITANILPSAKRLYYCFIPGVICDGVLRLIGQRNKTHKANVWSTYYQYQSLKRNLWNYNIVQAIKK